MISLAEQIAEAQRELALRRRVYPAWVKSGKLDAGDGKYQILVQEEIVRTLMRLDAEQRQLSLFSEEGVGGCTKGHLEQYRAHAAA
jgi:hypothetical protein